MRLALKEALQQQYALTVSCFNMGLESGEQKVPNRRTCEGAHTGCEIHADLVRCIYVHEVHSWNFNLLARRNDFSLVFAFLN